MNSYYHNRLWSFKSSWVIDAFDFMHGNVDVFKEFDIHKNKVYDYLFKSTGEEYDNLTKQCLEVIFSGFSVLTERLLKDHLMGGNLWNKDIDEDFRKETVSVDKSNVKAERDFGMLDYQKAKSHRFCN